LAQNYFLIDMSVVILPVVMYVMFMVVFEVSEFIDGRRAYRRWIGLPVKPYTPAEKYDRFTDFDTFYASFAAGTRRGQRVLNTYATKLFAIIVLVALAISVCESPSNASTVEDLRSYFTPQELDGFMDHMIFVLLLLATANVAGVFFAWSYRDGSFSRLIMGAIVAILASQWAYYFWTSLAKILQPSEADKLIYIALFTSMALIIIRMMWEMYKGYLRSRNKYIDWRVALLRTEAALSAQSTSPTVCVSTTISPGNLNGRGT